LQQALDIRDQGRVKAEGDQRGVKAKLDQPEEGERTNGALDEGDPGLALVALEGAEDEAAAQTGDHGGGGEEVAPRWEAVWVVGEGLPGELVEVPDCLVRGNALDAGPHRTIRAVGEDLPDKLAAVPDCLVRGRKPSEHVCLVKSFSALCKRLLSAESQMAIAGYSPADTALRALSIE
jgi:hypothetical protein